MARPPTGSAAIAGTRTVTLAARQRRPLAHRAGCYQIVGAPRSGKTALLVERAAYWLCHQSLRPASLTVLVQPRQRRLFAERLRARVGDRATQVHIETPAQRGECLLRELHARLDLKTKFSVATRSQQLHHVAQSCGLRPSEATAWADRIDAHKRGGPADETLRRYRLCYDTSLRLRQRVDEADLLLLPSLLIDKDPLLQTRLRARYRFVLIDDADRLDRLELTLLSRLLASDAQIWVALRRPQAATCEAATAPWLPQARIELDASPAQMAFAFAARDTPLCVTPAAPWVQAQAPSSAQQRDLFAGQKTGLSPSSPGHGRGPKNQQ